MIGSNNTPHHSKSSSSEVKKRTTLLLLLILMTAFCHKTVTAQESVSTLYVPLIGITAVPDPLALPDGSGKVTYNYAVKNFLKETALTGIQVVDDKCTPLEFIEGDDNTNSLLDHDETWRYRCSTDINQTTNSISTATGQANNITAKHSAYVTVVVGQEDPAPLVSIVNVTKIAYPLSLPEGGGNITYTYKVSNPGEVPLNDVVVSDDKCDAMSGKLGDTNGNNKVDSHEVWIYSCTTHLNETTTNTVHVTAYANGLKAVDNYTVTVEVDTPPGSVVPNFPNTGQDPGQKIVIWQILFSLLVLLIIYFLLTRRKKLWKVKKKTKFFHGL